MPRRTNSPARRTAESSKEPTSSVAAPSVVKPKVPKRSPKTSANVKKPVLKVKRTPVQRRKTTQPEKKVNKKRPIKNVNKSTINITVVDAHHHVLKPIWDAASSGRIPSRGNKFVHFDSHPDMGVLGSDKSPYDNPKKNEEAMERLKKMYPKIYQGTFNQTDVMRESDIATWIPTLVLQGLVDEVFWVAGWWCKQLPLGTMELYVGVSKTDGHMKIAVKDDKNMNGNAYSYWIGDESMTKFEDLEMARPWKLHVCRFHKNCSLPAKDLDLFNKVCKGKNWILDIDLDYLSCQNPFMECFVQMFGEDHYQHLSELYTVVTDQEVEYVEALDNIVKNDSFLKSQSAFEKTEEYQVAFRELCSVYSKNKSANMLIEFKKMCGKILPKQDDEDEYLHEREVHESDFITDAGNLAILPHHISSLPEIIQMLKTTRSLFADSIVTPPGVVTIATSNCDRYTPMPQGEQINELTLDMLTDVWDGKKKTKVIRRDYQSPFSLKDRYDPIDPSALALFLTRGKNGKLKPRSK